MQAIHIWCPRASESALNLRDSFKAHGFKTYKSPSEIAAPRLRKFLARVRPGDMWINWGRPLTPTPPDVIVFNSTPAISKFQQLQTLRDHGIATLETSLTPIEGWLGRSFRHQEGNDLLNNSGHDYWTRKMEFSRELRIHIFQGKSIHAGLKVPRVDDPHPWIRSYNSGWKIDYSRAADIAKDRRDLAREAVGALGLDFGAVDIGVSAGIPYVIEVNTAPGMDKGRSVEVYADAFLKVIR